MKMQQSNHSKNKRPRLLEVLVRITGYVWCGGLLISALFREEIHNSILFPWNIYIRGLVMILGFIIIIYYIWLSNKEKK